ncbi:hypothetical protein [Furfurilactobacillus entadae]|uniref:hypothetical protein n=1 Tax=Furfurilactobacillus entadae TaxID=2922307 RepID=UPI0035F00E80
MNDDELTNDEKYYLSVLYKEYLTRINAGTNKKEAKFFDNVVTLNASLFPEWSRKEISEIIDELKDAGFATCEHYMNYAGMASEIKITSKAVAYGEQKFKRNLNSVINGIATIKKLIL